jgi:putative endonuclease
MDIYGDMHRVDGKRGEDIAYEYLLRLGLRPLVRNWRCGHLEVDIIMEDQRYIHIVEVRSRTAPYLVSPLDSVDKTKQRKLFRAASAYAKKHKVTKEIIFDIVSVTYLGESYDIEYFEGAFYPLYV